MNTFGLVQPKCEGQGYLYDPEGFDPTEALERYHKLKRRWFKTRKVRAEMTDLDGALLIHSKRHLRTREMIIFDEAGDVSKEQWDHMS